MLFDNDESDSDSEIKTNNYYAKNYDNWRKKEELNKLKTKYGEEVDVDHLEESSSSSEDDDDAVELTEELEKDFFKTLSSLKKKDPRIYDQKVNFFNNTPIDPTVKKKKKDKEEPIFLKDYERKLLLEKGGQISDEDENEETRPRSPTYVEEQQELKKDLKEALTKVKEDDEDEEWGGMFKTRKKTKEEKEKEEADYKQWLMGQKNSLEDKETAKDLRTLKDYWNDPNLDENEKFLRDYILNKKFLDTENEDNIPAYEEIVHDSDEGLSEDEEAVEKQEEFEYKYNYRFEEPDQEFIKRYPRTIENSLRRKDDRRTIKRAEVKERKQKEKEEKMEELRKMQKLKKQEIEEKLMKLREITGNTEVAFEGRDIEEDFDPEEHDGRMQALFDNEFYADKEDDQKPEFPDLDEELEIERWDKYRNEEAGGSNEENTYEGPHCEDEDFNMDCDYDPAAVQKELIENSKGKKKRKRKSKFAEALNEPKPTFDPDDKTYEEYLDEYYKLDCEDIISGIPCRFKYRKVAPNSFGLTIEEILKASDKELNRWCSLKKAIQYRPDHVEKYDQIAFGKKGQNEALKRKLLPSLYADESTNEDSSKSSKKKINQTSIEETNEREEDSKETELEENTNADVSGELGSSENVPKGKLNKRKKCKKSKLENLTKKEKQIGNGNNKTKKAKKKDNNKEDTSNVVQGRIKKSINKQKKDISEELPKKLNKSEDRKSVKLNNEVFECTNNQNNNVNKKKRKRISNNVKSKKIKADLQKVDVGISDERLKAFGIKPKKFKNKLKYGNKNN